VSKIADLVLEIQHRLEQGQYPNQISLELDVPTHWVYEAAELADQEEERSPYATINS